MIEMLIGAVARWALTLVTTYLVAHHVLTATEGDSLMSDGLRHAIIAAPAIAALVWSLVQKYRTRVQFLTALDSPQGVTEARVKASIAEGFGASVRSAAPIVLLACALGFGVAAMPACAGNRPPSGTYSAVGQHAFDASQLIKDINAASQTAINLNHVQGSEHLHDNDTALIRNFALVAGAGLNAWGSGATTLDAARTAVDTATLPPGIAQLARQAFDKAVADHGAGASTLVIVSDLYTILSGALSAAAQGNPKLTAILAAVAAGVAAIPAQ